MKTVDFQGYRVHLHVDEEFIDGLTAAEEDQEFNETPTCETIAQLIAEILPSYYEVRVEDTAYRELHIERGKL